jgi:hypothetical protein
MDYFQTKNPNLGKFWRALECKMCDKFYDHLEYFTDSWDNLLKFGTLCVHLVFFPVLAHFLTKNLATLA